MTDGGGSSPLAPCAVTPAAGRHVAWRVGFIPESAATPLPVVSHPVVLDTLIVVAVVILAIAIGTPTLIATASLAGVLWLLFRAHHYGLIPPTHRR
jgi:hypothetical protein